MSTTEILRKLEPRKAIVGNLKVIHIDRTEKPIAEVKDTLPTLPERERAENMSVALQQRHRTVQVLSNGATILSDDKRRESALFWLCMSHKPRPLGDHCYDAGIFYMELVRAMLNAEGHKQPGTNYNSEPEEMLTDEQLIAKKQVARQRKREADSVLIPIFDRLPSRLESLVCDNRYPPDNWHAVIARGLVALCEKYNFLPKNIRDSA